MAREEKINQAKKVLIESIKKNASNMKVKGRTPLEQKRMPIEEDPRNPKTGSASRQSQTNT